MTDLDFVMEVRVVGDEEYVILRDILINTANVDPDHISVREVMKGD